MTREADGCSHMGVADVPRLAVARASLHSGSSPVVYLLLRLPLWAIRQLHVKSQVSRLAVIDV